MKKNILVILLSLVCTCSLAFAYLTSQDEVTNELTVGQNTTQIIEDFPDPEFEDHELKKVVQIKNQGNVDCYVRVFVGLSDESLYDLLSIDFNSENWIKDGDYYYYLHILKVNENTEPLFTSVRTTDLDIHSFDIIVYEESVQANQYDSYFDAFRAIGGIV